MGKKDSDPPLSEWEQLKVAGGYLIREFQDDPRFVSVDYWKECGECGFWLCVTEIIDDAPEEFMSFEVEQKAGSYEEACHAFIKAVDGVDDGE